MRLRIVVRLGCQQNLRLPREVLIRGHRPSKDALSHVVEIVLTTVNFVPISNFYPPTP